MMMCLLVAMLCMIHSYDSATNSYDPGNEVIIATYGNDMIDGGGGLNTADFSLFTSMGSRLWN